MAARRRHRLDRIANAWSGQQTKPGGAESRVGALSVARHFFSGALRYRVQDQLVANRYSTTPVPAGDRSLCGVGGIERFCSAVVARYLWSHWHRPAVSYVLFKKPGGCGNFDRPPARTWLSDRVRDGARAAGLAAHPGDGSGVAVLDIVFDSGICLDQYLAARRLAQPPAPEITRH